MIYKLAQISFSEFGEPSEVTIVPTTTYPDMI